MTCLPLTDRDREKLAEHLSIASAPEWNTLDGTLEALHRAQTSLPFDERVDLIGARLPNPHEFSISSDSGVMVSDITDSINALRIGLAGVLTQAAIDVCDTPYTWLWRIKLAGVVANDLTRRIAVYEQLLAHVMIHEDVLSLEALGDTDSERYSTLIRQAPHDPGQCCAGALVEAQQRENISRHMLRGVKAEEVGEDG